MRAPAARISSIRSWCLGRSSTIVVMSLTLRPNAWAIARTFSPIGFSRSIFPRARGPTAILRMYMSGRVGKESRSPTAIIDMAPFPPRATTPRPSSGSSARSTGGPPAPISSPTRSGDSSSPAPITIRPWIGKPSSAARIPVVAASSAASWSARPSQRAPASAARSVTRAYCSQRQSAVRPESSATSVGSWTVSATASDPLYLLGARVDELEDAADRRLDAAAVLEHGHGGPFGAPHDVLLDPADVLERLDVLVVVAGAFGREVPDQEVGAVLLHGLDREYALHDERALDRRTHADHDVARLLEKAGDDRVLRRLGLAQPLPRLEGRVVHGRHEVRGRHPRDPEPVGRLGRDRRLARARGAADEEEDRQVELLQLLVAPEPPDRIAALLLAEHLDRELLEALELDPLSPARQQIRVEPPGKLVRTHRPDADGDQRACHQPLRERLIGAAERQRLEAARLLHAGTGSCIAASARASISASRSSSPSSWSTSLSANTTGMPRPAAASATTSIAAALISTR